MKQTATNSFKDGLNLDLHPIVTPNTVLTDNLNGTFITYNGNEFCLQNDRGNTFQCELSSRTKTDGELEYFIPIGAKEYGGIIYIVSVTPSGDLTEIGTFPGVPNWDIEEEENELDLNKYHSLGNLYTDAEKSIPVIDESTGERVFRTNLGYDVTTPVTIDIQDSYDGSVNIIIIGGERKPIIINSGFSVLPENKYKIVRREQLSDTNKYNLDDLDEQLSLIRTSNIITNIDLYKDNDSNGEALLSGGQLKGGNYKFYIKFGDADYNQTDVVAESGIVSIFNGKNGDASTISGTLLDERTDKMVGLTISGLNHVYSKIYVYYSREYSDTNGYRMTEYMMLNNPIDMDCTKREYTVFDPVTGDAIIDENTGEYVKEIDLAREQTIWITGYEQEVPINSEEINIDYHTIDFAKAETQQANMLFLGNIGRDEITFNTYRTLRDWTLETEVNVDCAPIDDSGEDDDLYSQKQYYDISNIYYKLGYYPGEIYRFGIVYIFKDGSTSPVFNVSGGAFVYNENDELVFDSDYFHTENTNNVDLYKSGVIVIPDFDKNHPKFSVIKLYDNEQSTNNDDVNKRSVTEPIYLQFTLPDRDFESLDIKGWFVVRQKRIPNEICQGLASKVDRKSHLPLVYNDDSWISQSFLAADRYNGGITEQSDEEQEYSEDLDKINDVVLRYDNATYLKSDKGMSWSDFLRSKGEEPDGQSIYYLLRYTKTEAKKYFKNTIETRHHRGKSTSRFWKIDVFENNMSVTQFSNSLPPGIWRKTVYVTKFHVMLDGSPQYAFEDPSLLGVVQHKSRLIEVTYISKSPDLPTSLFVNPTGIMHERNHTYITPDSGTDMYISEEISKLWREYRNLLDLYGGSVEAKILKENIDEDNETSCFSSDAMISLDPCVDPTIKSILNGNKFWIKRKYGTMIYPDDTSGYYEYYGNYLKDLSDDFEIDSTEENTNVKDFFESKAVFIDSNTAMKVVDDKAFSNVAGNAADVSKFSYFTDKCLIERQSYKLTDRDKLKWELVKDGDSENKLIKLINNTIDSEQDQNLIKDPFYDEISDYKQANNINLIRGLFCPYIGIVDTQFPNDCANIYSIRLKKELTNLDIKVRAEDNSEYFCVSPRHSINKKYQDVYGGDCFVCTSTIRIIRNFIDPVAPICENILKPRSWLYYVSNMYYSGENGFEIGLKTKTGDGNIKDDNLVDFNEINLTDVNTVDLGLWVTFRTLSSINLGLRSKDFSHVDEMSVMGSPRTFYPLNGASTATGAKMEESWLLNDGYNATVGRKRYNLLPDVPYTKSEFSNRIMFSNVNVTDAFINGYRTFQGLSYKDYDKQYGEIVKLVNWGSNILCVMEHGIGLITVNEKALMQTTTGEAIHIYGHGVLPDNMTIISQDYGSKYPNSVIRTPIGVYGIDTDARKIWRFSDKQGFETISDMKIESYLNDNLFTNEESIIETVDVRTHYNAFKGDVMFTFYKTNKKFLIPNNDITLNVGEEIPYKVKTNIENLIYEVEDPDVIELRKNNDGMSYIKSKSVGNSTINVIDPTSVVSTTTNKKYLTNLTKDVELYRNQYRSYSFKNPINRSLLQIDYDPNIVSVEITSNRYVKITAISEGKTSIVFRYNDEEAVCNVTVKEYSFYVPPTQSSGQSSGENQGGSQVDPYNPQVPSGGNNTPVNQNCIVFLEKPRIGKATGEIYPDNCTITVTVDGVSTDYEFIDRTVWQLSINSNSQVSVHCPALPVPNETGRYYMSWDNNIRIQDRMSIKIVLNKYVHFTINSVSPSNAVVKISGDVVNSSYDALVGTFDPSYPNTFEFPNGNFIIVEAEADGCLPFNESYQLFDDKSIDINLIEGEDFIYFHVDHVNYNPDGSYGTTMMPPPGIHLDYTIERDGETITGSSTDLVIGVKSGDILNYELIAPGYRTISNARPLIIGNGVNQQKPGTWSYVMEPDDYGSVSVINIPDGYNYVNFEYDAVVRILGNNGLEESTQNITGSIWTGTRLHFPNDSVITFSLVSDNRSFDWTVDGNQTIDVGKHV